MNEYIAIYALELDGYYHMVENTVLYPTIAAAELAAAELTRIDWILIDNYTGEILLDKRG